ncbi:MAG: hypothetical protein M5U12_07120 [Verrucomicrobia bacterium]|nr:hypothetical protein [Verrucomicrobiota bacterium]
MFSRDDMFDVERGKRGVLLRQLAVLATEGRSLSWRRLGRACRRWVLGVGLAGLTLPGAAGPSAHAADHGLALAYPVDGSRITIDGDLSDWPEGLPRYGMGVLVLGAGPTDAEDFSAWFRLAYSEAENVLYVAIEVQDAQRAEASSDPIWIFGNQEPAIVLVRSPAGDVSQEPLGFLQAEQEARTVTSYSSGGWIYESARHFQGHVRSRGNQREYEFRIDLTGMTQGSTPAAPGQRRGFERLGHGRGPADRRRPRLAGQLHWLGPRCRTGVAGSAERPGGPGGGPGHPLGPPAAGHREKDPDPSRRRVGGGGGRRHGPGG